MFHYRFKAKCTYLSKMGTFFIVNVFKFVPRFFEIQPTLHPADGKILSNSPESDKPTFKSVIAGQ